MTIAQQNYPRDLVGYGRNPPDPRWPGEARVAVQFVLNYEEGGENCLLHGDAASEAFLSDISGAQPWPGMRHWNMESMYEYGARAGFWRLRDLFASRAVPLTIYGVASALARSPEQVAAMQEAGWEIASHGLKWIDYRNHSREAEAADMAEAIRLHREVTGSLPRGWYTGRCSVNTVDLATEAGIFDYVSDTYDDDLPYWRAHEGRQQLIIPYSLETNDMRFSAGTLSTGEDFYTYLKDTFDTLYREGLEGSPKMFSVGLHCRLVGRPGRAAGLARFVEYVLGHERVWTPRRIEIAEHWARRHPPVAAEPPSARTSEAVRTTGGPPRGEPIPVTYAAGRRRKAATKTGEHATAARVARSVRGVERTHGCARARRPLPGEGGRAAGLQFASGRPA